jgi:hypothetical protein
MYYFMKKIILAITMIVLATCAFAQQKIEFGVKAGLNVSSESADEGSTDSRVGLHAGFFAEFFISNQFGIQPELQYSMQGGKSPGITDKFDYVNLPVVLKIYVFKRDLSINVGPQFSYLVSGKYTSNGNSHDIYKAMNKFDVAVGLGASYKFAERFHVALHHNFGFIKLLDRLDNKNSVTQLSVGVRF